jgi:hypothetical protein
MQNDAPLDVGLLEDAGRLIGFALFLKRHKYDVILGHDLTPFSRVQQLSIFPSGIWSLTSAESGSMRKNGYL